MENDNAWNIDKQTKWKMTIFVFDEMIVHTSYNCKWKSESRK